MLSDQQFRDSMLVYLTNRTDGEVCDVVSDRARECIKQIMDWKWDWINNIDITFSDDYKRIKVRHLTTANKYEVKTEPVTLFSEFK